MKKRQFINKIDLEDIFRRCIFISIIFLSASIIFNIEIQNIIFYVYISLLIGAASYFMERVTISNLDLERREDYAVMITHLVAVEKAIEDIQVLCTDEDILERCKKEVIGELALIKEEIKNI